MNSVSETVNRARRTGRLRRISLRIAGVIVAALVTIVLATWLVYVPSAKEAPYRFVLAWCERGTNPGQFHDPAGAAIAGREVFAAVSRNNRMVRWEHMLSSRSMIGFPAPVRRSVQNPPTLP